MVLYKVQKAVRFFSTLNSFPPLDSDHAECFHEVASSFVLSDFIVYLSFCIYDLLIDWFIYLLIDWLMS